MYQKKDKIKVNKELTEKIKNYWELKFIGDNVVVILVCKEN